MGRKQRVLYTKHGLNLEKYIELAVRKDQLEGEVKDIKSLYLSSSKSSDNEDAPVPGLTK